MNFQYDVVLLTEGQYVNPVTIDWYVDQVLTEDRLVAEALEKRGLKVRKTNWDNPLFDWSSTRCVLLRTTWDYSGRFPEFSAWLQKVSQQTRVINPIEQVYWNIDKHYLLDLGAKGVPIPPTHIVEPKTSSSLKALQAKLGWEEMVLKPAISAGGRHTYRLNKDNLEAHEAIFQELILEEALLLQPFLYNIINKGEVALMVIGGKVTHGVIKRAKKGDFRVQDDFGGSVALHRPDTEEIALAEQAVAACAEMPLYARVDMVWNNDNQLVLSEIELIEPEMWFRHCPNAADALADCIAQTL